MKRLLIATALFSTMLAAPAGAITLDGVVADGLGASDEGLTLLATQDTGTQFGNSSGTQSSTGGSELNQMFADINSGVLELGISGNLESNFNKMWIFFDAVDGGENVLLGDNLDGGFNEIQAMTGLTFPVGMTPDHGIRLEIGGGFYGIRFFDLITNTSNDIATGGGPGDLPLSGAGGPKGITVGWDNSNVNGVTDSDASTAGSATTGIEFEIDLVSAFNGSQGDIEIVSFVTSSSGDFLSNQFLPGIGGGGNPGDPTAYTITSSATVSGPVIDGALPGDVDGDGGVDLDEAMGVGGTSGDDGISDFDIIRMNWLETNESFGSILARGDGDLNENGEVGIEDFREWKTAFEAAGGSSADVAAAFATLGVPEPASGVLCGLIGAGLMARRRRAA